MTTPTITADEYTGFLDAPVLRNGGVQHVISSTTVAAATATTTVIGLVPFRKGARLNYGGTVLAVTDLDTGTDVTLDFGYVYDDDTTYTNDPNAFIAASTVAQAGGLATMAATAGFEFVAEADGWFAVTVGGGATTTAGTIKFNGLISYDG